MFNKDEIRNTLQKEVREQKCERLLQQLIDATGITGFGAWDDVLKLLHDTKVPGDLKDSVLSAMFKAMQRQPDPAWLTVMTLVFWPALEAIHSRKRKWDANQEERWQRLYMAFLDAMDNFVPERRPGGISTKIFCDTLNTFHAEYQREWQYMDAEIQPEKDDDLESVGDASGELFDESDDRLEFFFLMVKISDMAAKKSISRGDYLVLAELYAEGLTLAEFAEKHGLSLEAAKKRRKRALEALKHHFGTTF